MSEQGNPDSVNKHIKNVKVKHTVDEETIQIGKGTEKVSQKDTARLLEERLDTLPKDAPERAVYEKIYKGNKQFN